ncbi:MAG: ABC transporter ATP-binding protein [Pseudomonadota bacterium]
MSTVILTAIDKHYAGHLALSDINLTIQPGEFIVMVGPSGCGKSTLLKTIAGLESISSGRMEIAGRDVTKADPGDRGIAMVFQSYALYPHMTVAENMGFGLRMAKRPQAEIDAAVARAAKILKLEDHLGKRPKSLSGGQRQRVAIGRAITRSPEVFLFDEPLSNLDASLRTQMRVEISSLHKELGATMIYVTHDQVEAMTMADRIVILNAGKIEQVGSPLDLYANPANQFVAGFLGAPRMNFVAATVQSATADNATVTAPGLAALTLPAQGASAGDSVTVGLRPEHIRLAGGAASLPATVRLAEHLGRDTVIYADAGALRSTASEGGNGTFTVQLGHSLPINTGDAVTLGFDPVDAYLFAADGTRLSPPRKSF